MVQQSDGRYKERRSSNAAKLCAGRRNPRHFLAHRKWLAWPNKTLGVDEVQWFQCCRMQKFSHRCCAHENMKGAGLM